MWVRSFLQEEKKGLAWRWKRSCLSCFGSRTRMNCSGRRRGWMQVSYLLSKASSTNPSIHSYIFLEGMALQMLRLSVEASQAGVVWEFSSSLHKQAADQGRVGLVQNLWNFRGTPERAHLEQHYWNSLTWYTVNLPGMKSTSLLSVHNSTKSTTIFGFNIWRDFDVYSTGLLMICCEIHPPEICCWQVWPFGEADSLV